MGLFHFIFIFLQVTWRSTHYVKNDVFMFRTELEKLRRDNKSCTRLFTGFILSKHGIVEQWEPVLGSQDLPGDTGTLGNPRTFQDPWDPWNLFQSPGPRGTSRTLWNLGNLPGTTGISRDVMREKDFLGIIKSFYIYETTMF